MDAGGAVLDRQARHQVHRHARLARAAARRRSVGDGGVPAPDAGARCRARIAGSCMARAGAAGGSSCRSSPAAATPPRAVRDVCWRCHGVDGTGRGPGAFPEPGRAARRVSRTTRCARSRFARRFSGIMSGIAAQLSDEAMREIAVYYERLPARDADATGDRCVRGGARKSDRHDAAFPIATFRRAPSATARPQRRRIRRTRSSAGQHVRYLTSQLALSAGAAARRIAARQPDARVRRSLETERDQRRGPVLFGAFRKRGAASSALSQWL